MPHLEIIHHRPPTAMGRFMQALRSYTGPLSLKDPELARKLGWGGGATAAGVNVSETSALTYAAVWQAVTLIAGDVGSLPLIFYKKLKGGGKERYTDHTLYSLLHDAPNSEMSSMVLRETMQAHLLTWGNAYAEIERDGAGRPVALWPLLPSMVAPFRDRGMLRYRVTSEDRREVILEARDVLHVPGLGYDGIVGYSPIRQARESLGLLAATEKFGASFFGNGSTFGGALKHPKQLGADGAKNLRASIDAVHRGPERAHKFLILEEGMDYQKFGVHPNDAQFLETRQFQIAEVARWFNLPLHKLREMEHSSVRANIEQEALDYYTSTLRPWLVRWEQEINRKLISPRERYIQFAEFLIEGAVRGDQKSRYDAYAIGRNWGWLSVNEIRALENMNPIADGDMYLSPLSMVPAGRINEVIDKQVEDAPAPVMAPQAPAKDDDEAQAERAAFVAQMAEQAVNIGALQARHEQALQDLAASVTELETVRARVGDAEARANTAAQLAEALVASDADLVAARGAFVQQRDAHAAELAEVRAKLSADVAQADSARDAAQAETARVAAELSAAHEAREAEWSATHDADQREIAGANVAAMAAVEALNMAEAARIEADRARETAQAEALHASRHATAATAAATAAEQRAAEAESARVTAVGALSDARDQMAGTLANLVTANRAVLVEVFGRLVRREVERVRNKRQTPEKILEWATNFYEQHEAESWVDDLRPVMAMHLLLAGSDASPDEAARALVLNHFETSKRQIVAVTQSDEFAKALPATLARWEQQRAEQAADAFMREEIAYVRSIQ